VKHLPLRGSVSVPTCRGMLGEGSAILSPHLVPKREPHAERCMLSHDMYNCVSIILGECELLVDMISNNAEAIKRVNVILQTAHRMADDMTTRPCPTKF
jgi:hypothetical protein